MKKTYKTPEVRLVELGEELLGGLKQESVQQGTFLPDPDGNVTVTGQDGSSSTDTPEAKHNGRGFWDDEY